MEAGSYETDDLPANGSQQTEEDDDEPEETSQDDDEDDDDDDDDGVTTLPTSTTSNLRSSVLQAVPNLDKLSNLRELGSEAVCWQLSSAKPGNGVEQIRDPSLETYWQSDGQSQPHWIQVQFARRVAISHVCLYLDYPADESYTPKAIEVQAGMTQQDLQQALERPVDLLEPAGWCILPLHSPPDPLDAHEEEEEEEEEGGENDGKRENSWMTKSSHLLYNHKHVVRAHLLRISILSMHQNGRDTHIRQVRLYGPRMHQHPQNLESPKPARRFSREYTNGRAAGPVDSIHSSQFTMIR